MAIASNAEWGQMLIITDTRQDCPKSYIALCMHIKAQAIWHAQAAGSPLHFKPNGFYLVLYEYVHFVYILYIYMHFIYHCLHTYFQ